MCISICSDQTKLQLNIEGRPNTRKYIIIRVMLHLCLITGCLLITIGGNSAVSSLSSVLSHPFLNLPILSNHKKNSVKKPLIFPLFWQNILHEFSHIFYAIFVDFFQKAKKILSCPVLRVRRDFPSAVASFLNPAVRFLKNCGFFHAV